MTAFRCYRWIDHQPDSPKGHAEPVWTGEAAHSVAAILAAREAKPDLAKASLFARLQSDDPYHAETGQ